MMKLYKILACDLTITSVHCSIVKTQTATDNGSFSTWLAGNLSRHTEGTVWAKCEFQLGQEAQYGHSMTRFSVGTIWGQLGHKRVKFQ